MTTDRLKEFPEKNPKIQRLENALNSDKTNEMRIRESIDRFPLRKMARLWKSLRKEELDNINR